MPIILREPKLGFFEIRCLWDLEQDGLSAAAQKLWYRLQKLEDARKKKEKKNDV